MRFSLVALLFVATALAQSNPVPFVNQPLVPTSTAPGGSAFTLTVNGTGFVSGAVVNWNGAALATTFVSSSQLTAAVPAANIATAEVASITVTNPTPGGGTSNVQAFDVVTPIATLAFINYSVPSTISAGCITTADFNGDGKPDLAYWSNNSIFIQLGNGDATFQSALSYAVGNSANYPCPNIVAADFNGDGKLDLAVTNYNDNTVSILLGNGDGTFQPQAVFATGTGPGALVTADFNGDGKLDLAVTFAGQASSSGGFSVLLGNGDGTFQPHVDTSTPSFPYAPVTGDFNRDGNLDLAILDCNYSEGICNISLSLLLGNGDGTFQPASNIASFGYYNYAGFLLSADLNGDDNLDLVVADIGNGMGHGPDYAAAVFLGNGDGTFQPEVNYYVQFGGFDFGIEGAVLGDFAGNGKLDFAYNITPGNAGGSGSLAILPGNGDGTFQDGVDFPAPGSLQGLAAADFNGDGRIDFVDNPNGSAIPLFVGGQFPTVGLSSSSLSGSANVASPAVIGTVTVTNTGTGTLSVSGIAISGTNANQFSETDNCVGNLAASANCQVNVTFAPTQVGALTATLTISDNAFKSPAQTVSLSGIGYAPAVGLSPSSVTFPGQYVGTSGLPITVTVTNTGNVTLTVSSATASTSDFGVLSNCTNPVAAGANCTIGVFFDPTASGSRTGQLVITDNAPGSPQTLSLTGNGQDFSMTPSSSSQTVNPGQTATYSLSVAPIGGFNQTVALTCSGLPNGSTCTVSPSSAQLNGSSATQVIVSVTTIGSSAALPPVIEFPSGTTCGPWLALFATFGLGSFVLASSRRRRAWALAAVWLMSIGMSMCACGGSSNSSSGSGATASGSYSFTVTGAFTSGSTNLTHSTKLTMVVN